MEEAVGDSAEVLVLDVLDWSAPEVCHRTARGNWREKVGLEAAASRRETANVLTGGIVCGGDDQLMINRPPKLSSCQSP